jgi:hypothetical protein
VDQSVNAILNLNEGSEVGQISDPTVDPRPELISLMQSLPGIILYLFHAEANPSSLWIDTQHFHLDRVARVHEFTRMLDPFGPTHLGDVHQTFDSVLEFDESAVISHAGNSSGHSRANRKTLINARPRIGQ